MSCHNHPSAKSVANCARCDVELCGTCANFLDVGVYCEKCAKAVETENFVTSRSALFNKRETNGGSKVVVQEETSTAKSRHSQDKGIIWLGIGSSAAMIFFSLILYAYPSLFEFDAALAAELQAEQALEDCRLIFEEIGYLLEDGELPDASMRCSDSNSPNVVTSRRDTIRVSHPNPGIYGLSALYVTSDSHEVILEE